MQDLDSQVVFFVHHQADVFLARETDAARTVTFRQLSADELSFDEELAIDPLELVDVEVIELTAQRKIESFREGSFDSARTESSAD